MDKQKAITVNIINRNYPPAAGITGESASELAAYLIEKGINVNIICVDIPYKKQLDGRQEEANIFSIKTFYSGKHKLLRLLSSLFEGYRLIRQSKQLTPDITICMTDPPLLNVWAAYLLRKKDNWVLWSMDLYPEAFAAGNLISTNNFVYRFIDRIVTRYKPVHIISLGPFQTNYLLNKYQTSVSFTQLPCGIHAHNSAESDAEQSTPPSWAQERDKIYLGYCGNLGEAHSLEFLYAVVDNLDAKKHTLILAVYGINAQELIDYASGQPGVIILPVVQRAEMKFIDIHLATLKNNWTNVCVPSKAVSSVSAGAALLYNGDETSDNWELLKKAGWLISDKDPNTAIRTFFGQLNKETIAERKAEAAKLAEGLLEMKKQAFDDIYVKLMNWSSKKIAAGMSSTV